MPTFAPFARPMYVMLKPVGARCNLACEYCYYLEKNSYYADNPHHVMSDALLEHFIASYIEAQTMSEIQFTWHGGEPLLRSLDFYRKALALQKKYARGRKIENCLQTNGTLLTDEWCRFFKENDWLVGVSIDGPKTFHDAYRKNKQGKPSFDEVMRGIHLLDKHEVSWNAMAVVNRLNADFPVEFYRFFKDIGCRYIQFTPVVERIVQRDDTHLAVVSEADRAVLADFSVTPEQWGTFLCSVFDEWVRQDVGTFFIQLFDATLSNWMGFTPGICTLAKYCGHAGVMEFNGDVYACDHFVFPEYKLGNLATHTLVEMMYGERQTRFGKDKYDTLPTQCKDCEYLFACHGECPRNRFCRTTTGETGLNYLCAGYYRFFRHATPYMDFMKQELLAERTPAHVMDAIARGEI